MAGAPPSTSEAPVASSFPGAPPPPPPLYPAPPPSFPPRARTHHSWHPRAPQRAMAGRVELRNAPWRATSSSAARHGGAPRAQPRTMAGRVELRRAPWRSSSPSTEATVGELPGSACLHLEPASGGPGGGTPRQSLVPPRVPAKVELAERGRERTEGGQAAAGEAVAEERDGLERAEAREGGHERVGEARAVDPQALHGPRGRAAGDADVASTPAGSAVMAVLKSSIAGMERGWGGAGTSTDNGRWSGDGGGRRVGNPGGFRGQGRRTAAGEEGEGQRAARRRRGRRAARRRRGRRAVGRRRGALALQEIPLYMTVYFGHRQVKMCHS
ncbi:hypothetical protein PVAP13_3NG228315 [Panicum virgatum]|uniref:Uncharacterized protein n=1 Tax=Panicum virgatum TaxID=38727 RepID=A0A8T0U8H8_PANVG|nr:hypothetical protein PVAP13_3NG228315 [Panicum virgatum]